MANETARSARRRAVGYWAILAMLVYPTTRANAQASAQVGAQSTTQAGRVATSVDRDRPQSRLVTIDLNRVPLPEALELVARAAGLMQMYEPAMLPQHVEVTLHVRKQPVEETFKTALQDRGLRAVFTQAGGVSIVRDSVDRALGQLQGVVLDGRTKKGIGGVTIVLDDTTHGFVTGADGRFLIQSVPAGTHRVAARLIGYRRQTKSVTIVGSSSTDVTFVMESNANTLDQVVVTGTVQATELKAVPNAMTIITAKQIEERGITRIDQLFRGDVPGLFSLNVGSQNPHNGVLMFSRGATALIPSYLGGSAGANGGTNPIKTYLDGVELSDPQFLSNINPQSIERIEILTGPQASTIYGSNAINGVMQIFTKRGRASKPELSVNWASGYTQNNFSNGLAPTHTADTRLTGTEGRLSYNLGGSWKYEGAWTPAKQTQVYGVDGGARMAAGAFTVDGSARYSITRTYEGGNALQGRYGPSQTGVFRPSPDGGLPQPKRAMGGGKTAGVNITHRLGSWLSQEAGFGIDVATNGEMKLAPGYSFLGDTALRIDDRATSRVSQRYSATTQIPVTSLSRLSISIGGDHWRTTGLTSGSEPTTLNGYQLNPYLVRDRPASNAGAYAQGQLAVMDALFLTYGMRAEWNPYAGDKARVLPGRYGASYVREWGSLTTKIRGSYGRSTRPPGPEHKLEQIERDPYYVNIFGPVVNRLANPDMTPEYQQGGEGGIELYLGNRASLVVTRYNQTVDNLISEVNSIDSVRSLLPASANNCGPYEGYDYCYYHQRQNLNVGSIRNQGWELQGSFSVGPLTTRGTYSYTKSRVIGVTPRYRELLAGLSFFTPGRSFDYLPEHTWAWGLTYAHARTSVGLAVTGVGQIYNTDNNFSLLTRGAHRVNHTRLRMDVPESYRPVSAGYMMSDLNVAQQLGRNFDATLQVHNLTDFYQSDASAEYATPGRQTQLGFRWRVN